MNLSASALIIVAALSVPTDTLAQSTAATQPIRATERTALAPTRNMIEKGRAIAEASCARCHGMDGLDEEDDRPRIAGQRSIYLFRVIRAYQNGHRIDESMGHASGFLNDEGLLAVAVYYASLPPVRTALAGSDGAPGMALEDDPFSGIRGDMRKCHRCHEESGNSTSPGMPNLTAQHPDYFKSSMLDYVDGSRNHKIMKKMVSALDERTIEAMGVYYAVQQPERAETKAEGNELAGRELAADCATCHGDDGNASDPDMPSLAGQDARYFVKAMNAYLHGEREHEKMYQAVENLSARDFADLAAFYAAREPVRRDVRMPLTAAQWIDRCERCHGLDGNSTDPRFPMLAGQNPAYLAGALKAYSTKARDATAMHAMADPLSDADIDSLVWYFASKEPKSVLYIQLPCEENVPD